ncbi:polyamine-transporting ATPase 13A3-like isoform X2 [Ostrea edulis]|uniref:polyamine-transporting ATPase 13A3-like isoform X2 n=1 Tax=Ostrea edulis TaxID=37623 RepID=UPI0024AF420A|nr:polyamine-transporting ATPase 13A3-like isoform X2 [Ostrea edulis]
MAEEVKVKVGLSGPPPMKAGFQYVNPGQEDQMEISGYRPSLVRKVIVWFFIIITAGLLRLVFYWLPHIFIKCTHSKCSLPEAKIVILRDQYLQWFVSTVQISSKNGQPTTSAMKDGVAGIAFSKSAYSSNTPLKMADSKTSTACESEGRVSEVDRVLELTRNLVRYFITKRVKYIWDPDSQTFKKLEGLEKQTKCSYFHACKGLTYQQQQERMAMFGTNSIQIHVTPIIKLLFKEVLSPFYIFQLFSCGIWFADEYYYYASCIVVISVVSITATIYQTRKMQRALRDTIESSTIVSRLSGDTYVDVNSDDLVPGDIISIPRNGCFMQCDAVLLTGNCIINESMLTGESVPVTKTPLPNPKMSKSQEDILFNLKDHAKHVLFCGTHILQTRFYGSQHVKAVVLRTGFSTAKGELVRSIMFPKPVDFKFNRDTYIFVGILAAIAGVGFIYTVVLMVQESEAFADIFLRSMDLITIAVPPALPAALTIGIVFAQRRLKKSQIYCISPRSINVSGTINAVCFDKTGTLTEDGLNMQSIVGVQDGLFTEELHDIKALPHDQAHLLHVMTACHSLTIIDGVLSGDPLDLIMFDATNWELEEPGEEETSRYDMIVPTIVRPKGSRSSNKELFDEEFKPMHDEIAIMRQFTFTSSLQRMSVITRKLGAPNFELFTKGAPEMIASLSKPETVPSNFHEVLINYTKHGYRVIALAYRSFPTKLKYTKIQRIQREQVERNLTFLGFLVMENRLKPETTPIIHKLLDANIRTVMVTGDNMLTALSVARECGMVGENQRIILVQAFPGTPGKKDPWLEYMYTEDPDDHGHDKSTKETKISMPFDFHTDSYYHFAMDGKTWAIIRKHFPLILQKICVRGTVFARMSPDQKSQLIEVLQELGYFVGMCGDGANDCGALKTAHAGISLSEAEASVASPFTSKQPNIECVPTLIRQGRGALVTSFGIFKYMACYSLTQFVTVLILYWIFANLTDFEFLYIDLFLLTSLSVTFGYTNAYDSLSKDPPLVSLFSVAPVLSILLHMGIQTAAQVFCYFNVQDQPWFVPYKINEDDDYTSYENMAVYVISMYQYITLAIVFSKGRPYRKTIFTNYFFLANLFVCIAMTVWLNIYPTDEVAEFFEMKPAPSIPYRCVYLGIAVINFFLDYFLETFIIESYFVQERVQCWIEDLFSNSKYQYEILEEDIIKDKSWPNVSSEETLAQAFERLDSQQVRDFDQSSLLSSLLDSASETQSIRSLRSLEIETSQRGPVFTREASNVSDDIYIDNDDESQLIKAVSPSLEGVDMFPDLDLEEEVTNTSATNK